ncbi:hypothetical protein T11_10020 [Trichinella zimbabwensis]|uniref:Uncharacterized protein n=1 Tax=Trichinella zimbabwensis TaxID=268475 RepID=A0A0V1GVZ0_9BILA|nr:hypothetical protein T11_10020 [Trichinella zimbabwensis]
MHNFPKSELKSVTLLIIELSDRCILSLDKSWVRSASTFDPLDLLHFEHLLLKINGFSAFLNCTCTCSACKHLSCTASTCGAAQIFSLKKLKDKEEAFGEKNRAQQGTSRRCTCSFSISFSTSEEHYPNQ